MTTEERIKAIYALNDVVTNPNISNGMSKEQYKEVLEKLMSLIKGL